MFALTFRDCFAPLFQKRKPSGLSEKTAFLLLAFLCAYFGKEKRLNSFAIKMSVAHFLFGTIAAKKKFPKRNGEYGTTRHVPSVAFEKAPQNFSIALESANKVPNKPKFER